MADLDMVNDAFWLKYAEDHVTAAISERDNAASKLDTYLGVVWPIYTAAFILGSTFNTIDHTSPGLITLLALPILLIPIAHFLCTWVQLPPEVFFHENSPSSIKMDLYGKVIKKKSCRLQLATGFAIICGISIGVAVFAYEFHGTKKNESYSINILSDKDKKKLRINGSFSNKADVIITVIGLDTLNADHCFVSSLHSDEKGKIDTLVESKSISKQVKAFASFKDDNKNQINLVSP